MSFSLTFFSPPWSFRAAGIFNLFVYSHSVGPFTNHIKDDIKSKCEHLHVSPCQLLSWAKFRVLFMFSYCVAAFSMIPRNKIWNTVPVESKKLYAVKYFLEPVALAPKKVQYITYFSIIYASANQFLKQDKTLFSWSWIQITFKCDMGRMESFHQISWWI